MVGVYAKIRIQDGKMDQAMEAVKALMAGVAEEKDTLLYTLNRDQSDPNLLIFMERYTDMDAFRVHTATPHFKAFSEQGRDFIDGRIQVEVLEEIASI